MTALSIRALGHHYGDTPAVHEVDLTVQPGEIVALLGRSGCGKTTVLRAIAGLLTPTRGQVAIGGQIVADGGRELVPTEKRGIGLVFQDYALFPSLTVAQNIAFGLRRGDPQRVQALLDRLQLTELAQRRPAQLSGGQQQRVGLARALAPRPSVLLLDEPFANLDGALRMELGALLRDAVAEDGAAAVLVSHDRADALALADRLALMGVGPKGGVILRDGRPEDLYLDPRGVDVAQLTGEAWFLDAEPDDVGATSVLGPIAQVDGRPTGRLCVRPESVRFTPCEGPARVRYAAFQGSFTRLVLEHPDVEGPILAAHGSLLSAGSTGRVEIARAAWIRERIDDAGA
ncbi:MAG: ABC transporter ATP-binding protein [Deltaproteobacteria bacterium]|nr:MAG: ABC transporter ATP-binding protein [Deltaproteobacteria bacterium]